MSKYDEATANSLIDQCYAKATEYREKFQALESVTNELKNILDVFDDAKLKKVKPIDRQLGGVIADSRRDEVFAALQTKAKGLLK